MLNMLSRSCRENWDKLETWRGTYRAEDIELYWGKSAKSLLDAQELNVGDPPAELRREVTTNRSFVVDFKNDRLFSSVETRSVKLLDAATNRPLGVPLLPYHQRCIVTGEHYVRFQPNMIHGPPRDLGPGLHPQRTAFRERPEKGKAEAKILGAIIDPRAMFTDGQPIWETFNLTVEAIKETGPLQINGIPLQVFRNTTDSAPDYRVVLPGMTARGRYLLQETTFSAAAGYNPTLLIMRESTGRVRQQTRWKYRQQDGIWLPTWVEKKVIGDDGLRIRIQRTLTLQESRVNEPIPPETFTYRRLGLADGDRLIDRIAGTVSMYENGTFRLMSDQSDRRAPSEGD